MLQKHLETQVLRLVIYYERAREKGKVLVDYIGDIMRRNDLSLRELKQNS